MKLRIRGNSIRFRLSKGELTRIEETGAAEDSVQFSPQTRLRYRVEVKPSGPVEARFEPSLVTVALPRDAVRRWVEPAEVSIAAEQPIGGGQVLKVLVEKDFVCIAPRAGEDSSDLFENPLARR